MTTIKEIAKKAGVSIGTVDRVIHNRGGVSPNAELCVKKAIADLKYTPNIFARQLKLSRAFTFGVLMPQSHQDGAYWEMPVRGMKQAQKELESHRIHIQFFHYDRFSQMSFSKACEAVLNEKLDGLLLAPALSSIAEEFISRLPHGFPYVFFDSMAPESQCLSSIVQDSYRSGYLAARLMGLLIQGHGDLAILRSAIGDYHINERVQGFKDYFSKHPGPGVKLYDSEKHANPEGFEAFIRDIMEKETELRGLFVSNALTYCAAKAIGNRKVFVIGYDLLGENVRYLKEGKISFLISQQSQQQGYQGVYALFRKIVLNEEVPKEMMMPIDIITKENVDYYPV